MLLVALAGGKCPAAAFFFLEKQELRSCLPGWDSGLMTLPPPCLSLWLFWGIKQHPRPVAVLLGWRHHNILWLLELCGHLCHAGEALGCWGPWELEVGSTWWVMLVGPP